MGKKGGKRERRKGKGEDAKKEAYLANPPYADKSEGKFLPTFRHKDSSESSRASGREW